MAGSWSSGAVKITEIGSHLRDRHDAGLVGGMDDVARVDQAEADAARDRRLDGGVVELRLALSIARLVGLDLRCQLRDGGASAYRAAAGSRILPSLVKRCRSSLALARLASSWAFLAMAWSSAAWNGRGSISTSRSPCLDHLAFLEGDLVDLAVDAGAHHDGVEGLHGAEAAQIDRKVGLFDRGVRTGTAARAGGFPGFSARLGFSP